MTVTPTTPTTPIIEVAPLRESALMADIIGECFAELDVSRHLIPDDTHRRRMLTWHLHQMVLAANYLGRVLTDTNRIMTAVWFDIPESGLRDLPGYEETRRQILDEHDERFALFEQAMHEHHPTGTHHWYLALMAVRPTLQRAGMGTALLQYQHTWLDQQGLPAYLEAADQDSRRLYARHGYLDHGPPFPCTPTGPLIYPMWRPPRTATAATTG